MKFPPRGYQYHSKPDYFQHFRVSVFQLEVLALAEFLALIKNGQEETKLGVRQVQVDSGGIYVPHETRQPNLYR